MPNEESQTHRRFSREEKAQAVLRLIRGGGKSAIAAELGVPVDRLERWHDRFLEGGRAALVHKSHKGRIARVREKLGSAGQWSLLLIVLTASILLLLRFLQNSGEPAP